MAVTEKEKMSSNLGHPRSKEATTENNGRKPSKKGPLVALFLFTCVGLGAGSQTDQGKQFLHDIMNPEANTSTSTILPPCDTSTDSVDKSGLKTCEDLLQNSRLKNFFYELNGNADGKYADSLLGPEMALKSSQEAAPLDKDLLPDLNEDAFFKGRYKLKEMVKGQNSRSRTVEIDIINNAKARMYVFAFQNKYGQTYYLKGFRKNDFSDAQEGIAKNYMDSEMDRFKLALQLSSEMYGDPLKPEELDALVRPFKGSTVYGFVSAYLGPTIEDQQIYSKTLMNEQIIHVYQRAIEMNLTLLQQHGWAIADFNPSNILFNPKTGRVYLIDVAHPIINPDEKQKAKLIQNIMDTTLSNLKRFVTERSSKNSDEDQKQLTVLKNSLFKQLEESKFLSETNRRMLKVALRNSK